MGKNKYIETPEKMWELFVAYKKEVKDNPRLKHVFVGRDGTTEYERLERPLTMAGFSNYCRRNIGCVHDYFANTGDAYDNYSNICTHIREEIREDQITGGMVGQYNPSITQRLNGLKEQTESTIIQEQPLFPD